MARRIREPRENPEQPQTQPEPLAQAEFFRQLDAALRATPWSQALSGDIEVGRQFDQRCADVTALLAAMQPAWREAARKLWQAHVPSNFPVPAPLAGAGAPPSRPPAGGVRMVPRMPDDDPLGGIADADATRAGTPAGASTAAAENVRPPAPGFDSQGAPPPAPTNRAAERIERVVTGIVAQDPARLYEELEAVEKLPGRTLSLLIEQLDLVITYASKASRLAMIAHREYRLFRDLEAPAREAVLRDKARAECPPRQNKDGTDKALTAAEVADWIAINCAEELHAIKLRQIDLESFAEHAANLARIWSYRSRDLQEMIAGVRATGDGVSVRD